MVFYSFFFYEDWSFCLCIDFGCIDFGCFLVRCLFGLECFCCFKVFLLSCSFLMGWFELFLFCLMDGFREFKLNEFFKCCWCIEFLILFIFLLGDFVLLFWLDDFKNFCLLFWSCLCRCLGLNDGLGCFFCLNWIFLFDGLKLFLFGNLFGGLNFKLGRFDCKFLGEEILLNFKLFVLLNCCSWFVIFGIFWLKLGGSCVGLNIGGIWLRVGVLNICENLGINGFCVKGFFLFIFLKVFKGLIWGWVVVMNCCFFGFDCFFVGFGEEVVNVLDVCCSLNEFLMGVLWVKEEFNFWFFLKCWVIELGFSFIKGCDFLLSFWIIFFGLFLIIIFLIFEEGWLLLLIGLESLFIFLFILVRVCFSLLGERFFSCCLFGEFDFCCMEVLDKLKLSVLFVVFWNWLIGVGWLLFCWKFEFFVVLNVFWKLKFVLGVLRFGNCDVIEGVFWENVVVKGDVFWMCEEFLDECDVVLIVCVKDFFIGFDWVKEFRLLLFFLDWENWCWFSDKLLIFGSGNFNMLFLCWLCVLVVNFLRLFWEVMGWDENDCVLEVFLREFFELKDEWIFDSFVLLIFILLLFLLFLLLDVVVDDLFFLKELSNVWRLFRFLFFVKRFWRLELRVRGFCVLWDEVVFESNILLSLMLLLLFVVVVEGLFFFKDSKVFRLFRCLVVFVISFWRLEFVVKFCLSFFWMLLIVVCIFDFFVFFVCVEMFVIVDFRFFGGCGFWGVFFWNGFSLVKRVLMLKLFKGLVFWFDIFRLWKDFL